MSFEISYTFDESESESDDEYEYEDVHQDIQDNIEALWVWVRIIARHLFPGGLGSTNLTV